MTHRFPLPPALRRAALCAGLLAAALPAQAGLFDSLFGSKAGEPAVATVDAAQRTWKIGEFTTVQIVPAEPGASPNQHPARVTADALRWNLGGIRATVGNKSVNLFAPDELNDLSEPLAQALSLAGPGDDVQLVSSSRRGASILTDVTAVTARLFVQDGALQFIVRDARLEFVREYIGSRSGAPKFVVGSRAAQSKAVISNSGATSRRADWLALGLTLPGAAPATVAQPAPPAAPVPAAAAPASPTAPVAAAAAKPAAPAAAPALEPLQTEAEHRLATLKRLRDRGLISEEEFQEKRKDVLKQL